MSDTPIYIHGLKAHDFMRLELVELSFDGPNLTIISGNNAEGKSSLLRAIMAALGGKEELPEQPVRKGAKKSEVEVDLGDKVVRLKVREDRSTTLTVEGKDGATYRSPQALLNEMIGKLAFDPLEFLAREKEQAATLRKLVGLDTSALDSERQRVFDQRTGINRECKLLDAQLAGLVVPPEPEAFVPGGVPERISVSGLADKLKAAISTKQENDRDRRDLAHTDEIIATRKREIASLETQLAEKREALEAAVEVRNAVGSRVEALVDPDVSAIEDGLKASEELNAAAAAAEKAEERRQQENRERVAYRALAVNARLAKEAEAKAKHDESERLTARLEQIDEEKAALLGGAKFPCSGLSIDGEVVTYNGSPLAQCSSAEQLSVCLSVAAALNPRLRVLLVRQGNDLDPTRLRQVAEWAREQSYQVLMERVAGATPVGVVIEAGKVALDARGQ